MAWKIMYHDKAKTELSELNNSARVRVLKAIQKVSENPLPQSENGYGKPLGNKVSSKLAGLMKIKLKSIGIRVVYQLIRDVTTMKVLIISVRDDNKVYKDAEGRINLP